MDEDQISRLLRRGRYSPSAAETERFVSRVMEALPATGGPSAWRPPRWFAPALGFSFAALAVSLLPLYRSLEEQSAALLFDDQALSETIDGPEALLLEAP